MTRKSFADSVLTIAAIGFVAFIIIFANTIYPLAGNDFRYFIPRLLDAYIHYKVNGLSIQWYTPMFAGGLPAYPNPQDTQFTLPQLLMLIMNPWWAFFTASAIYIFLGFYSAYYFFEHILGFEPLACALGSIFFNVNGFIISQTVVGHLGYQAFPLFPIILIALTHSKLSPFIKGLLVSLVLSILIHSGGFYVIVIYTLSLSMLIPVLILINPSFLWPKSLFLTSIWAAILTTLLSGSKIYASLAFLGLFPRIISDNYQVNLFNGLYGIVLQFAYLTVIIPLANLFGIDVPGTYDYAKLISGTNTGLWEFNVGLSPALLLLIIVSIFISIKNFRNNFHSITKKSIFLLILLGIFIWITIEFRLTNGWIYPNFIRNLPIIRSLHVNLRFAAAFIFPFSLIGAWCFNYLKGRVSSYRTLLLFLVFVFASLFSLSSYFLLRESYFKFAYDLSPSMRIYENINRGDTYPVDRLEKVDDTQAITLKASSLEAYEPILGYELENFNPQIHPGSVWDQNDGYFNMTNPASLVFPRENNSYPFERIKITDREKLEAFINHRQPDWKRPLIQEALDVLMMISFIALALATIGFGGGYIINFIISRFKAS